MNTQEVEVKMKTSKPSTPLHVKHFQGEEFDVEHVFADSSSNPPAVIHNEDIVAHGEIHRGDPNNDETPMPKAIFASLLFSPNNKKIVCIIAAAAALGFVVIAGALVGDSAARNQQQMNAATTLGGKSGKTDKSGKATSFCEPSHVVASCGQTFTNKVTLSKDLFCTESVSGATDTELMTLNAAIKLEGPDASIDCKGFTVRQVADDFGGSAVNCNKSSGASLGPTNKRKIMKQNCDLYYQIGIWLADGATAINCKVEQFYEGFFLQNGGEVKKSETSRNRRGIHVQDVSVSTAGTISKISNLYAHDNFDGIFVYEPDRVDNFVIVEDSTSYNNLGNGMTLRDSDITVKDSTFSYSGGSGMRLAADFVDSPTKVTFKGEVSSHHNDLGIDLSPGKGSGDVFFADIIVEGVLNTYLNLDDGLSITNANSNMSFTVENRGSFNSCENGDQDIVNEGLVDFVDEGTGGYTYDNEDITGTGSPPTQVICPVCTD